MTFEYGIFDNDDELRFVNPDIKSSCKKVESLGWGKIFKIIIVKDGEEIV